MSGPLWFLLIIISAHARTPIVLWHGLGDTCCNPLSIGGFKAYLEKELKGVKVFSLKIGSNFADEVRNSYAMNSNDQIQKACEIIQAEPELREGYNAIGFSQGGQFLRAVAQRCSNPPMRILVSLGGQHQGIFGLPDCPGQKVFWCDYIRRVLDYGAYFSITQKNFVPAQYWHDPLDESTYRQKSIFLADINNERSFNHTYKENLSRLQKLVLIKFGADRIVQPRESSWFGWYKPNQDIETDKMEDTILYKEDRIGLKTLNDAGKLVLLDIPGADHLQFSEDWFTENVLNQYFRKVLNASVT